MTFDAVVIKKFTVVDYNNHEELELEQGSLITYERYRLKDIPYVRISFNNRDVSVPDFIIEEYVQTMTKSLNSRMSDINEEIQYTKDWNQAFQLGKESAFSNQYVQIERIESVVKVNKFLSNIKRENVIDIKPMEFNTYLIIYTKEDKE